MPETHYPSPRYVFDCYFRCVYCLSFPFPSHCLVSMLPVVGLLFFLIFNLVLIRRCCFISNFFYLLPILSLIELLHFLLKY